MARKVKNVGLMDTPRVFSKRKAPKGSKRLTADQILKYIDKGLKYAEHPLVSATVQAIGGAMQPSEQDVISAQLAEGKGTGLLQRMGDVGALSTPIDPSIAVRKKAAADQLQASRAAFKKETAMEDPTTIMGPQPGEMRLTPPGIVAGVPRSSQVDPELMELQRQTSEAMLERKKEKDVMFKLYLSSEKDRTALEEYIEKAEQILGRAYKQDEQTLREYSHKALENMAAALPRKKAELAEIDSHYKQWQDLKKQYEFEKDALEVSNFQPELTPDVVPSGLAPQQELSLTPPKSFGTEGLPSQVQFQRTLNNLRKQGKINEEQWTDLSRLQRSDRAVARDQLVSLVSPTASRDVSPVPGPIAETPVGPDGILPRPETVEVPEGPDAIAAGLPAAVIQDAALQFPGVKPLFTGSGAPSVAGGIDVATANLLTEELRRAQNSPDLTRELTEIGNIISQPIPTFDEMFPDATGKVPEVLPNILPGSWEGVLNMASRVRSPKEQQRLISHARENLGGRAKNIWEAIASIGGDTAEKTGRLNQLVAAFPKRETDTVKQKYNQVRLERAKLEYTVSADRARTKKAQARAKLIKLSEDLHAKRAGTSRGFIGSAKKMKRLLRSSLTSGARRGMRTNDPKELLKQIQKQSNVALNKSETELSRLITSQRKLLGAIDGLYTQSTKLETIRLNLTNKISSSVAPKVRRAGKANPAYGKWKSDQAAQNRTLSSVKTELAKIEGKRTSVDKRMMIIISDIENKQTERAAYNKFAADASSLRDEIDGVTKMEGTKQLVKRLSEFY